MVPIILVGNHDKRHAVLTDGDTLASIGEAGVATVVTQSGPIAEIIVGGRRLGLGGTPHGQDIPGDVSHCFPDADAVTWLTHHDIAFDGSYPGARAPFEIDRSEEHTSELQSLMRISYADFCLKNQNTTCQYE